MRINFKNPNGNEGAVVQNGREQDFIAVTPVWSKHYKTIKGAEKAMNKKGYERV